LILEIPQSPSSRTSPSSFARDLRESRLTPVEIQRFEAFVNSAFPAKPGQAPLRIVEATEEQDRAGVDYFATSPERHIPIQMKVRAKDCRNFGYDDIALEIVCDIERQLPGWALDVKPIDAYMISLWRDTGRFAGPFLMSRVVAATQTNLSHWAERYPTRTTHSVLPRGLRTQSRFMCVDLTEFQIALASVSVRTFTPLPVFAGSTSTGDSNENK